MKTIKTINAVGTILSHDVTEIVPGEFKGVAFRKGHVIKEEDIEKLLSIGKENVYVWTDEEGKLHENTAAKKIADLVVGSGIYLSTEIKEGKIDFFAEFDGMLSIDTDELLKINMLGEIIVATLHNHTPVKQGEKIGSTRVIPLVIDEKKIKDAEEQIRHKFINVIEFKPKKCRLITTGNEVYKGRIKDAFLPVITKKLEYYGSVVEKQVILPDNKGEITQAINDALKDNVDFIMCTGGMSVDPDDVTPTAIIETGSQIITYGAPVLPGSMFLLAYNNGTAILGVPSCAMYSKRTILDLVLPRVLVEEKLSLKDIAKFGNGGICLNCDVCTFPHCNFGK